MAIPYVPPPRPAQAARRELALASASLMAALLLFVAVLAAVTIHSRKPEHTRLSLFTATCKILQVSPSWLPLVRRFVAVVAAVTIRSRQFGPHPFHPPLPSHASLPSLATGFSCFSSPSSLALNLVCSGIGAPHKHPKPAQNTEGVRVQRNQPAPDATGQHN